MRWLRKTGLIIALILIGVQAVALVYYWRDQRDLESLFNRIASPSLPPSEQAKLAASYLEMKSADTNQSYFLLSPLQFLRATPWQVAVGGGDCADRSRLLIALLRTRGIKASKWALYTPDGRPVHAVVELQSEHGKMVVDPLFDLWFPRPGGGYYGIQDLQQNPGILRQRVQSLRATGQEPLGWLVRGYPVDKYVYDHTRTINWNKSAHMRFIYRVFYAFMGERANRIQRPFFVEQPALMIVFGIAGLESFLLLVWLGLGWRLRHKKSSQESPSAWSPSHRPLAVREAIRGGALSESMGTRPGTK